MLSSEFFFSIFWLSTISLVWFNTDWFIHYSELFGIFTTTKEEYKLYIERYPEKYFPDFLHQISLNKEQKVLKFVMKLVSCPFCLLLWMSIITALLFLTLKHAAPLYIGSLFTHFQIRNFAYKY